MVAWIKAASSEDWEKSADSKAVKYNQLAWRVIRGRCVGKEGINNYSWVSCLGNEVEWCCRFQREWFKEEEHKSGE